MAVACLTSMSFFLNFATNSTTNDCVMSSVDKKFQPSTMLTTPSVGLRLQRQTLTLKRNASLNVHVSRVVFYTIFSAITVDVDNSKRRLRFYQSMDMPKRTEQTLFVRMVQLKPKLTSVSARRIQTNAEGCS